MATLAAWLALVLAGFTLIFWGIEDIPLRDFAGWRVNYDADRSGSRPFRPRLFGRSVRRA